MMNNQARIVAEVGPRELRTDAEFAHWEAVRSAGFTPWYVGTPRAGSWLEGRAALNAVAAVFPEFFHQARLADGRTAGYLQTVPGYWGGSREALHDFHQFEGNLSLGRKRLLALELAHRAAQGLPGARRVFDALAVQLRRQRLRGTNSIVLLAMNVDAQVQGMNLPSLFFAAVRRSAAGLAMQHIIAPFRPSGYGHYKAQRGATHTAELFAEYCALRTPEGLPQDPWLRAVARNGASFLRLEPRSFRLERPLARFEHLRATFKPGAWYSPEPDVWECGETPTWYVDRARGTAVSVEPNLWGTVSLQPPPAAVRSDGAA